MLGQPLDLGIEPCAGLGRTGHAHGIGHQQDRIVHQPRRQRVQQCHLGVCPGLDRIRDPDHRVCQRQLIAHHVIVRIGAKTHEVGQLERLQYLAGPAIGQRDGRMRAQHKGIIRHGHFRARVAGRRDARRVPVHDLDTVRQGDQIVREVLGHSGQEPHRGARPVCGAHHEEIHRLLKISRDDPRALHKGRSNLGPAGNHLVRDCLKRSGSCRAVDTRHPSSASRTAIETLSWPGSLSVSIASPSAWAIPCAPVWRKRVTVSPT